jgi:hypothetical protein
MSIECSTAQQKTTNELENDSTVSNRELLQEKVRAVFELPAFETLYNGKRKINAKEKKLILIRMNRISLLSYSIGDYTRMDLYYR